ncbi:hypothetical protein RirG_179260 [Rhizophagus irregularis DAOM 197198w]|uniref:RNase H type-1 domain-containing protein n=1 Tax=Rhizophagus irregularis (strain DAOM 197198w) TaxID=1432141 RepID=A0A015M0U7_RHIIW|nr:hypothetical protein RirG_179260 [Rhizophagus irregularis DAOM 197198w]
MIGIKDLTYRTHYIPVLDADTRTNLTPKKVTPILRPCPGQCGHSVPFSGDLRPKCIIVSLTSQLILFNVHAKKFIPNKNFLKLEKTFIFPVTPLHMLRTLAFSFTKHRLIIPNVLPSTVPILSTLDSYLNANSEIFNNSINLNLNISSPLFINNIFVGNRDLIIQLLEIAKQFLLRKNFTFYTDGSLTSLDVNSSTQTQMGFAWIEITDATPNLGPPPPSYKGALSFNPSSTKAEVYALLTAIIAVPDDSELDVFTDSLNVIHTFHVVMNKLTSTRRILKCNNHLAWRLIDILITKKSLIVRLHKVKAHSNDYWNE